MNDYKSIFMTGITSGIGREVLRHCVENHYHVTGLIRNDNQRDLFQDFDQHPMDLLTADLAMKGEVLRAVRDVKTRPFDYIFLNAGCADSGLYHQNTMDRIEHVMETNLMANMRVVHELLPQALENQSKFIFVSSLLARLPSANYTSYGVSKAALTKFCLSLRKEYPQLKFLCLEIGAVNTPMHEKAGNTASRQKFKSVEVMGEKVFRAIQKKEGIHTLSWDWNLMRNAGILLEGLLHRPQRKKA